MITSLWEVKGTYRYYSASDCLFQNHCRKDFTYFKPFKATCSCVENHWWHKCSRSVWILYCDEFSQQWNSHNDSSWKLCFSSFAIIDTILGWAFGSTAITMSSPIQISVASLLKIVNCIFVTTFNFLEVKLRFLGNMRYI